MNAIVKVISTFVDGTLRKIKFYRGGTLDVKSAFSASPFGFESNPIANMKAIYAPTQISGEDAIIGYFNKDVLAEAGESRIFSLDSNGNLKAYIWLKSDGVMRMNGNSDFGIGFNKTKESIDEIKDDINALKQVFSAWVTVPSDGGAALKAGAATWFGQQLTKNIDDAKKETIKLP